MKPINWFGTIIIYTVLTLLLVYLIPSDSAFSILRIGLGFVFVAFLPGYCLLSFLFEEGKLDFAEKIVLSVALSFSIAGISGLFLGLSPAGISVTSIIVTLSPTVVVLASLSLLKKLGRIKIPVRKIHIKIPAPAFK